LESFDEICDEIESSFMIESLISDRINFRTQEMNLSSYFLSSFASVFSFETWEPELEIRAKSEMGMEDKTIQILSC
jgi:hypothetical protein